MWTRLLLSCLLAGLLAGCQTYAIHGANKPRLIQEAMTVTPKRTWNVKVNGGEEIWTVDGEVLQSVRFWNRLEDGRSLFAVPTRQEKPVYRSSMTPNDVVNFVAGSVAALGAAGIETGDLRPAKVAGRKGFRFEMDYALASGIEQKAVVFGVRDGANRLSLVMYSAHPEYYFDRHIGEVAAMLRAANLKDS